MQMVGTDMLQPSLCLPASIPDRTQKRTGQCVVNLRLTGSHPGERSSAAGVAANARARRVDDRQDHVTVCQAILLSTRIAEPVVAILHVDDGRRGLLAFAAGNVRWVVTGQDANFRFPDQSLPFAD